MSEEIMEEKGQVVTGGGMKRPKFDGRVEEFEEWKYLDRFLNRVRNDIDYGKMISGYAGSDYM